MIVITNEILISGSSGMAMSSDMWTVLTDAAHTAKGSLPVKLIEPNAEIKDYFARADKSRQNTKQFSKNPSGKLPLTKVKIHFI